MNKNTQIANREVCNCIFLDYKTKKPFLYADYVNTTTYDFTGDVVYATGGQGAPKKVSFHGNKGGTIVLETQITPAGFYSLATGAEVTKSGKYIAREKLTVGAEGAITLTSPSVDNVIDAYEIADDCGTPLAATGSGTEFTITGAQEGDQVIVYYWLEKSTGLQNISIKNTTFPKNFIFQGDTQSKTTDDEMVNERYIAYKLAPQPQFSIGRSNTGDPASITLTCDLLVDNEGRILDIQVEDEE